MYELVVKTSISSSHILFGHSGKCKNLHGHNWNIEAFFHANQTGPIGISMDFTDLKKALNKITEELDHKHLNDLEAFHSSAQNTKINPTAENISKYIFESLENELSGQNVKVSKVTIWETEKCACSYFR